MPLIILLKKPVLATKPEQAFSIDCNKVLKFEHLVAYLPVLLGAALHRELKSSPVSDVRSRLPRLPLDDTILYAHDDLTEMIFLVAFVVRIVEKRRLYTAQLLRVLWGDDRFPRLLFKLFACRACNTAAAAGDLRAFFKTGRFFHL